LLGVLTMRGDETVAVWLAHPGISFMARLAVVSPFLVSGIVKAVDFSGAVAEVRNLAGVEPAWLVAGLVIATQLGGSLLVLAGSAWAWLGATLLAGFTVFATVLAHAFWTKTGAEQARDLATFFEHVSIVGGFLLVAILVAQQRARR
jgi:transmembrane protein